MGAELVEVLLSFLSKDLEIGLPVQLLEAHLEHGDDPVLVVDVEYWVVDQVLEGFVRDGVHLFDRAAVGVRGHLANWSSASIATLQTHAGRLEIKVVVDPMERLLLALAVVGWSLVWRHGVLRAHFQDALVFQDLVDEGAVEIEVVDVIVLEVVEERQLLQNESTGVRDLVRVHVGADLATFGEELLVVGVLAE